MKCQSLFAGKSKKNVINLSSEDAQGVVKVNTVLTFGLGGCRFDT